MSTTCADTSTVRPNPTLATSGAALTRPPNPRTDPRGGPYPPVAPIVPTKSPNGYPPSRRDRTRFHTAAGPGDIPGDPLGDHHRSTSHPGLRLVAPAASTRFRNNPIRRNHHGATPVNRQQPASAGGGDNTDEIFSPPHLLTADATDPSPQRPRCPTPEQGARARHRTRPAAPVPIRPGFSTHGRASSSGSSRAGRRRGCAPRCTASAGPGHAPGVTHPGAAKPAARSPGHVARSPRSPPVSGRTW